MTMNTPKLAIAALLASLALPALAEDADPVQGRTVHRIVTRDGAFQTDTPHMVVLPRGAARHVKNAPYSAQMIAERQQNLSDGNQIVKQNTTMFYRDSAGRTRQEIQDDKGELKIVKIDDPAAGNSWILNPQTRSATKISIDPGARRAAAEAARKAGEAARAQAEQMRREGKLPGVERRKLDDGREEIIVKRVERAERGERVDGEARKQLQEDVRIRVSKSLEENGAALRDIQTRLAPLTMGAFGDAKWSSKAVSKDLGARDFGGVKAEGKLRSYEIPAGEIGNRNPIVVADETWYAPDLQVTVYSKHSDPRSGDTVLRLENIKRDEPAASLFTVPSDYTVKDPLASIKK